MSYFISLTAIFMAVFAFNYITRKKAELLFPIVSLGIVFSLYIFGLCGLLFPGGFIILFLVIVLFGYALFKVIKTKDKEFVKRFFSPLMILLIVFSVCQFVALLKMQVISWDELTHWGLVVKNMFYHRNFGGGVDATTMFKGYPVGSSLFLYFFEMFGFNFQPAYLYMAMNLLNISLLLPIAAKFKDQKQKIAVTSFLLIICLIFNYKMLFSIWNDMFLSLSFAYVLISYFCFIKKDRIEKINIVSIMFGLFGLVSSKSTGLILAIFACIIIGFDLLFNKRNILKLNKKKSLIAIGLILLSILLPKISWSFYLKTIDVGGAWQTSDLTVSNICKFLINPTSFQRQVVKNFLLSCIWPFKNTGNAGSLPIPLVVEIAIIIVLICMVQKKNKGSRDALSLSWGIFISLIAYVIGTLISYLFTFSQTEALRLASFVRYVNTFTVGIVVFLSAYIFSFIKPRERSTNNLKFLLSICTSFVIFSVICLPIVGNVMNNKFAQYKTFSSQVEVLNRDDKIYVIDTSNNLKNYLMLRFISTPIDASGLKIGGSPHIGDVWSGLTQADEIVEYIVEEKYNILYLHNVNEEFAKNYARYFETEPLAQMFYSVMIDGSDVYFKEI